MRLKTILSAVIILVFTTLMMAQEKAIFDPNRNPQVDLEKAIKVATESNKRILLDVGGNWCIWCRTLDKFINSDSLLTKTLDNNYVVIKVNYSKENKNEEFLKNYPKVEGYPHIFILENDGKLLLSKNTGDLEEGKSYSKEKLLKFFLENKKK